jgi:hypothetical protein
MRSRWYSSGTMALSRIWLPHAGQVIIGSANCSGTCADADINEPVRAGRPRFPSGWVLAPLALVGFFATLDFLVFLAIVITILREGSGN